MRDFRLLVLMTYGSAGQLVSWSLRFRKKGVGTRREALSSAMVALTGFSVTSEASANGVVFSTITL